MRHVLVAFISLIFLASCGKNSDEGITPTIREEALKAAGESCRTFVARLNADFAKVPGAFYDYLTVPEDASNPNGLKIKVFYYGRVVKGRTPVVFFNGGPAGNSHSSYVKLVRQQLQDEEWSKIPFIFIDQRGTGCSDPYPQGSEPLTLRRLANYGTRGIVGDAELIRQHLGLPKWKIFGQSYGAFLVHRYVVLAPDSIVAAYAHAGIITSDPMQRLTGRIRSQNRVLEAFLTDFPSDREVLSKINLQLTNDVCFTHVGFAKPVCGLEAIDPLLSQLGFTDGWPDLNIRFNLLLKNGWLNRERIQQLLNKTAFAPSERGRSTGVASLVLAWSDRNIAFSSKENCTKIFAALRTEGLQPENWLFNECMTAMRSPAEEPNELWQEIRTTIAQDLLTIADFKTVLAAKGSVPFFLYSGAKDPYVPADDYVEELAAVKPLLHYTHFLGTGHDGFYSEAQVWEDILSVGL